ncbi:MAG: ABC transporter permease [Thermoflexaceae bacterium]|nr:ABC transporter permease [Thermoflexaceae bacterium]
MFDQIIINMIVEGFWDSIYMTLVSTVFAYLIGLPLGIILVVTDKDGIRPMVWLNGILGVIINILRSVPFLILLITIIPFTRWVTGTSIGTTATIVPLVVAAAPFIARVVESSLKEVDKGVIEAAQSMGTSTFQLIYKVLLPESLPSLVVGAALAVTTILSYSALAGFTGGGGLGDIAIRYGYNRYQTDIMLVTVALLVVIVQVLQEAGMKLSKVCDKRRR